MLCYQSIKGFLMLFTTPVLNQNDLQVIERIDEVRRQLRYALSGPRRWTGLLRRSTFARAIQGSNSIEGYNVTLEDAIAAAEGEEPFDTESETWSAITGYRDALTYILQLADDPHFTYGEGLVRSLHYMMLRYDLSKHPGKWRPGPIYARNEKTGLVVYEGPDAGLVPGLMKELVDSLNAADGTPVMVRAAMAHLNLVMVHPFSDGNGRMARALQTLVLTREGILSPQFCSIEEYLGRNTEDYYAVLAEVGAGGWHPERDARPWVRFTLTAHYRQATTLLRRSREMERVWEQLEVEVQRRGLPDRTVPALVEAAFGLRVRNSTYRTAVGVSENLASRDFKVLVDAGLLVPKGERRGRSYVAPDWIRAIRDGVRELRSSDDPFA